MRVRSYSAGDHGEWRRMRSSLWPDQTESDMEAWLGRSDATVIVAERDGGGLCGFIEVGARPHAEGCATTPVAYIEGWWVDGDARGRGVGGALMGAAEEWARARGFREMGSDTGLDNDVSRRAHEALGFSEVDRAVVFRKSL